MSPQLMMQLNYSFSFPPPPFNSMSQVPPVDKIRFALLAPNVLSFRR